MKQDENAQNQEMVIASVAKPPAATRVNETEIDFIPEPDEVGRKAYFTQFNQGLSSGHEVQRWLAGGEPELIAERNRTRVHGLHNKT